MTILVTGANGYVGQAVLDALAKHDAILGKKKESGNHG
jgi:uncharacterized protein YbjT (DUF2867 family)